MALKVILPIFGIFGTFTGAVLATNNNSRSEERASTSPHHQWKVQPIKSIEIPFSCVSLSTRSFQNRSNYTLKAIFDVKELEVKNFLEVDSTGVGNVRFEFVTDGDWGQEGGFIKDGRGQLSMNVSGMDVVEKGIKVVINNQEYNGYKSAEFACSDKSKNFTKLVGSSSDDSGDNVIFFSSMSKSEEKKLISMNGNSDRIKVEIEKSSCKVEEKSKKTATCNLKLSDTNGNKWSAKLSDTAKLTFI